MPRGWRALLGVALALLFAGGADAQGTQLPPSVRSALERAQIPADAIAVVVQAVDAQQPLLAWNAERPMNPASLFKLVTTQAALELLGADFAWTTPVWLAGTVRDGVLEGDLAIKGQGDPKLTVERIWLLLHRVRELGVREIRGDIVIDRSAFAPGAGAPGDFDGEPLRPYNVGADALLLAQRSLIYRFTPDARRGIARVGVEPLLDGLQVDAEVPLSAAPCNDWRAALKATPADPARMRFAGSFAAACGEQIWPLAYPDPAAYDARLLVAMWRELGGRLGGQVRDGAAPAGPPSFVFRSPPLPEIVRDINKYSNNTMAQQLFLTLAWARQGNGTPEAARELLAQWLADTLGAPGRATVVDNGSGLSRRQRVSAAALAGLLLHAWREPTMPELMASLPLAGLDGTLRRSPAAAGRAHLKTGSLRDVVAVAGYVLGEDGQRRVLVAMVQHPQADAARPVLQALVAWTAAISPGPRRAAPARTGDQNGSVVTREIAEAARRLWIVGLT